MGNYKYVYIDAQYVLTRNFQMIRHRQPLSFGGLSKSFFQSIVKITREVPTDNVVLLWDKFPYHRHAFMEDYKGDRKYDTEEDLKDDTLTDEVRSKIEKNLHDNKIKQEVKYYFVANSGKFGMSSIIKKGFEADDHAYIAARTMTDKICLCSSDSDWKYLVTENADQYNLKGKFVDYGTMVNESEGLDPFTYKSVYDSLYGSHNNLSKIATGKYKIKDVVDMMSRDDYSFTSDKDLFLRHFASFNVKQFDDYDKVSWMIKTFSDRNDDEIMTPTEFSQFTSSNFISMSTKYFTDHINRLKQ